MRLCKYCNKPIAEKDIWNPDNDGNGYHHQCLVDMEFKARDKQIYDKGKMEVLDKIRAEVFEEMLSHSGTGEEVIQAYVDGLKKGLDIIDKYRGEQP